MFVRLFYTLRKYGVPVSTRELIDLNEAVAAGLVFANQDEFYQLAKTVMVKDERFFDKFDRAMKDYFDGIATFDLDELLNQVHKLPKNGLIWSCLKSTSHQNNVKNSKKQVRSKN